MSFKHKIIYSNSQLENSLHQKPLNRFKTLVLLLFCFSIFNIIFQKQEIILNLKILNPMFSSNSYGSRKKLNLTLLIFISFSLFFLELDLDTYKNMFFKYTQYSSFWNENGSGNGNRYHHLTRKEIFSNENRQKILIAILKNPGIHYNKLKRKCSLSPGQIQWHLTILIHFKVIEKEKAGRFVVYFATLGERPENEFNLELLKSKSTMKVLGIIKENPGICASTIAKIMDLKRNSIKYHIDKLFVANLIDSKKNGRKNELFLKKDQSN